MILNSFNAFSTHLMGGHLNYSFVEVTPTGHYKYKISLITFINCDATSNYQFNSAAISAQPIHVGIYEHDDFSNPYGGNDKTLITSLALIPDINSIALIYIPAPSNCLDPVSSLTNCIYSVTYEEFVELGEYDPVSMSVQPSVNGYHVVYDNCCRNGNILNLSSNISGMHGICFHSYIPPDFLQNSSPTFELDSASLGCIFDTNELYYTVNDIDGDVTTVSISTPLAGGNTPGVGSPITGNLSWPILNNVFEPGFSVNEPFGNGSFIQNNSPNQKISMYSTNQGSFVFSIEIKEYRNNQLIGFHNEEIQLMFTNCNSPTNNVPFLDNSLGTIQTQFSVAEQDTLCFDFGFNDIENDSILLLINGDIFDSNIVNPPASITNFQIFSAGPVTNEFCWTPSLGQASGAPYTFNAIVYDLSCDNNYDIIPYEITVTPSTLDISEYNQTIKAYPNPTAGKIKIELQKGLSLNKIELYNLNSQLIAEFQSTEILINKLKKGAYFLKVYYGNKIEVLKIFKQ